MKPKTVGRVAGGFPSSGAGIRHGRAYEHDPNTLNNGLPVGTSLLTLDGALPVEFLSPGDRIITRDVGLAILRDIRVVDADSDCVAIRAGSLGHSRPEGDMLLPATQRVLVRDWRAETMFGMKAALVPISRLVDGQFVSMAPRRRLRLVKLIFDAPHILYADGIEVESASVALQTQG